MTKSINLELGSPYETGQRDADLFGDPGLSSSSSRRLATLFHEEQQQTGGGGGTAKKRDDTDLFGDPTSASTVFRGQQIVGEEELDDSDNNHFVATSLDDDPKEDDDHVGGGSNVPSASSAQEILQTSATVDQVETHIPEIRRGPVLRFNPLPAINTSGDKNQLSDEVAELWSGPINRAQNARLCSWILAAIAVLDFVICLTVVIVKTVFDKEDIPRAVVVWLVLSTVLLAVAIMMIVWAVWYQRHTHRNINDAEEFIRSIHPSTKTLPPTPQAHGHGEAELTAGGQDSSDRQQENPYQNVTGGNDSGKFVANSMSTRQLLRRSQESLAAVGEEGIELAQLKSKMPPSQTMNSFMSEFVSSYAEPYSPLSRTSAAAHNTTPTTHQRGVPSVDIIGGKATGL
ncbi:hypothetical protein QBC35DRAFT_499756 [Podospora australis]|uniref:Transmembrane protein n=1 Tax=Podospora australis TaxID=1536484 RepID=A0AAN7AIC7_9PEZI|nr:hypothetical protein QBC35DRAFT_499756 [Podospora australis]